jgi:hypothetical protein
MTAPIDWKQKAIAAHEFAMTRDRPPAREAVQEEWRREVAFVLDAIEFAGGWVDGSGFIRDLPCASHDMAFRGAGYRIAMVTIWWPHHRADRLAQWINALQSSDWTHLAEDGFLDLVKREPWDQEAARKLMNEIMYRRGSETGGPPPPS